MAEKNSSVTHQAYTGVLVLDNINRASFLRQKNAAGNDTDTLMMLDDSPTGEFTPAKVNAAYQCFSGDSTVDDGDQIIIYGFCNYPPQATFPVLRVSSYAVRGERRSC
jgi:hypothetical protein